MFYSQVILAKKGPLAKVWLAAHWGDKKLARPQIFATDIAHSVDTIVNPTMPLALRMSSHLLLGVVRIYSRKVKYVLSDCTEAMLKLQMAFANTTTGNGTMTGGNNNKGKELLETVGGGSNHTTLLGGNMTSHVMNFGDYEQVHVVEGFCLPLPDQSEWIVAEDDDEDEEENEDDYDMNNNNNDKDRRKIDGSSRTTTGLPFASTSTQSPEARYQPPTEEMWVPFDPEHEDDEEEDDEDANPSNKRKSRVSDVEIVRAAGDSFLSEEEVRKDWRCMYGSHVMSIGSSSWIVVRLGRFACLRAIFVYLRLLILILSHMDMHTLLYYPFVFVVIAPSRIVGCRNVTCSDDATTTIVEEEWAQ